MRHLAAITLVDSPSRAYCAKASSVSELRLRIRPVKGNPAHQPSQILFTTTSPGRPPWCKFVAFSTSAMRREISVIP